MPDPESTAEIIQSTTAVTAPIQRHERHTKHPQTTSQILMIEPTGFHFNYKTAVDNKFQKLPEGISAEEAALLAKDREGTLIGNPDLAQRVITADKKAHQKALREFRQVVDTLQAKHVDVYVVKDNPYTDTPDSIFPNNPISFHQQEGGIVVQHLMKTANRKLETKLHIGDTLIKDHGFKVTKIVDLRNEKKDNGEEAVLEGTGSMVLDRENGIVYACLSQRTTTEGLTAFAKKLGYQSVVTFTAKGSETESGERADIYHTNVMMSVGKNFALICLDAISNRSERAMVKRSLEDSGKEIIKIDINQMNCFCGNMLEIKDRNGKPLIAMSLTARDMLRPEQLTALEKHGEIISSDISTIETNGGGSYRCMLAEVHLPKY